MLAHDWLEVSALGEELLTLAGLEPDLAELLLGVFVLVVVVVVVGVLLVPEVFVVGVVLALEVVLGVVAVVVVGAGVEALDAVLVRARAGS